MTETGGNVMRYKVKIIDKLDGRVSAITEAEAKSQVEAVRKVKDIMTDINIPMHNYRYEAKLA